MILMLVRLLLPHPFHYKIKFCLQDSLVPNLVLIKEEEALEEKSSTNSHTIIVVCFLAVLLIVIAMFSNALAFLVFYKKPMFRKILSNR